jgi:pSer/pThr/pTyr-binding forkhead associated (FHA) protein
MTRLVMRRGPHPGKVFELDTDIITIGSGMKNNIVIQDPDIGREHCKLIRVMADYELHDLDSARGTFVSGQRLRSGWLLKPGNVIELGEHVTLEYGRNSAESELEQVDAQDHRVSSTKPHRDSYPSLVITAGPQPGQIYPLKADSVRIGRDITNDIVIQDPEISRFHLMLRSKDGSYQIEDLGSTNGTSVNSLALTPKNLQNLRSNDSIMLAKTIEMRFTWQPEDVRAETQLRMTPMIPRPTTKELDQLGNSESKILGARSTRQTSRLGTGLQPGMLVDHIFIAYARQEWSSIVAPLMALLQDDGLRVWVDQYLNQGGDDWMLAVEQALSECSTLLIVISPEALDSRYVRLAYRYFFNREKPIVPLIYAAVEEMPMELRSLKTISYDGTDRKQTFDDLIAELKRHQKPKT